jgi:hypothetical protein
MHCREASLLCIYLVDEFSFDAGTNVAHYCGCSSELHHFRHLSLKFEFARQQASHACTLFHTADAKLHGASDAGLQEIYFLASFTGRWSTMLFAQQYDLEKFTEEVHKIGTHLRARK